jgi:hypothetical protein
VYHPSVELRGLGTELWAALQRSMPLRLSEHQHP